MFKVVHPLSRLRSGLAGTLVLSLSAFSLTACILTADQSIEGNPRDPRSYDDTGWTLGALRNVKTTRVMDTSLLDAAMDKVDVVTVAASLKGSGDILLIEHHDQRPDQVVTFEDVLADPQEIAEGPQTLVTAGKR